ncbi:MAG TPA: rhodanese-like domain-containing protein [Candidatus Acidoferrum sp.]|nr:rhodanese-like domain-containing protein [Candidatus Acidoferrum sp.]
MGRAEGEHGLIPMASDPNSRMEIDPKSVKEMLDRGELSLFVDVREPWERETSHVEGATLIPLQQVPANLVRFQGAREIVVFCHHGRRSLNAVAWLRSQGIENARSMAGGIDRWSVDVDPQVPRY